MTNAFVSILLYLQCQEQRLLLEQYMYSKRPLRV
jgi:hypothetical protein